MDKIVVSNWRENREELAKLNNPNSDQSVMIHPNKIGKTQMVDIANALKDATGLPIVFDE